MNRQQEAGDSQDSTLPAKKLFKRRLKRAMDDDSDVVVENKKENHEASPAGGKVLDNDSSNATNMKTALNSKV